MMWSVIALAAAAPPASPEVLADLVRPTGDGSPFIAVESGRLPPGPTAAAQLSWARQPIRFEDETGGVSSVVDDAVALHLGARVALRPFQFGVSAPLYVVLRGQANPEGRAVLGDLAFDAKVRHVVGPVAVGALGRVGVPLGGADQQVGYPGLWGEVGGLTQVNAGRFLAALNLGYRVTPSQELATLVFDDAAWARVGAVVDADAVALIAEVHGSVPRRGVDVATIPVEGLLGVQRTVRQVRIRAVVGRGLSPAVGSPALRVLLGAVWVAPDRREE